MSSAVGSSAPSGPRDRPLLVLATDPTPPTELPLARSEDARRKDAEAALASLYRRVLDLEASSVSREAALRLANRELAQVKAELDAATLWIAQLAPQAEELVEMRHTKTFRWTSGPRRLYGRTLRRSHRG